MICLPDHKAQPDVVPPKRPGQRTQVVGPDRRPGAGLVQQQPELQRSGQQRAALTRLPQQRRGPGLRSGARTYARPSQQLDRRVQTATLATIRSRLAAERDIRVPCDRA
jgi:hypothetical protein